jgi:hypothetical protein
MVCALRVTWPYGHVLQGIRRGSRAPLLALLAGLALAACFNAPADPVLFACTPEAPECPTDYSCADDGCCHRDGSDITANFGACGLGGPASGTGTSTTGTSTTTGDLPTSASTGSTGTSTTTGSGSTTSTATDASSSTSTSTGP